MVTGSVRLPAAQYPEPGHGADLLGASSRGASGAARRVGRGVRRRPAAQRRRQHQQLRPRGLPDTGRASRSPPRPGWRVTPEYFRVLGLDAARRAPARGARRARDRTSRPSSSIARGRGGSFPNASAVGKRFREGGCTTCPWTERRRRGERREVRRPGRARRGDASMRRCPAASSLAVSSCVRTRRPNRCSAPAGRAAGRARARTRARRSRASRRSTSWSRSRSSSRSRCRCWWRLRRWWRWSCRWSASTA